MIKSAIKWAARRHGYSIIKLPDPVEPLDLPAPADVSPVWPLPRDGGMSDNELRAAFAAFPHWHYAYAFENGLSFATAHRNPGPDTDDPRRPLQRFRHFMPWVVGAAGGSLRGKRVLDVACNSGFWSIQCALLGAEVVGFDARAELVAQAELLKRATGAANAEFRQLDVRDMSPEALGGTFDVVLHLGLLYHLPDPLAAIAAARRMTHGHILLDTSLHPMAEPMTSLRWEEPSDIRMAADAGMVAFPSASAVELMLRHLGMDKWQRVPVRSRDIPDVYRTGGRASWLIEV